MDTDFFHKDPKTKEYKFHIELMGNKNNHDMLCKQSGYPSKA